MTCPACGAAARYIVANICRACGHNVTTATTEHPAFSLGAL